MMHGWGKLNIGRENMHITRVINTVWVHLYIIIVGWTDMYFGGDKSKLFNHVTICSPHPGWVLQVFSLLLRLGNQSDPASMSDLPRMLTYVCKYGHGCHA